MSTWLLLIIPTSQSELDQLGLEHNCDKASKDRSQSKDIRFSSRGEGHDYLRKYEIFFKQFRGKKDISLLELGAGPEWNIGASAKIWSRYFGDNSEIFIADIKSSATQLDLIPNVKTFVGDLGNEKFLNTLQDHSYDIVIDDASHHWDHQIKCFERLFKTVNKGGIYIIEDIHTSFGSFRQGHGLARKEKLDAFSFFQYLASRLTGDRREHPSDENFLENLGLTIADVKSLKSLLQSEEDYLQSIAMISFIKHSCIVVKDVT